jgi:hypothetical protein
MQRLILRGTVLGLGACVLYVLATVTGIFPIGGPGGGEGGAGPASTTAEPDGQSAPGKNEVAEPAQRLTEPLIVTIDSRRYLVEGQAMAVGEIVALAATVPEQYRVKVLVKRRDTSRADAEYELEQALKANQLVYEMKDE